MTEFNAEFWKFWSGQTVSSLGNSFTLFVLPLIVYDLTGSALDLGLATAFSYLPYPLFGFFLGAWADRVDRKKMMVYTQIARALAIASIPLFSELDLLSVHWIYLVSFVSSTLQICFEAGRFAAVPSLVGRQNLIRANGYMQASSNMAYVVGPLLAGAALLAFPTEMVLLFDASSFLFSAATLVAVKKSFNASGPRREKPGNLWHGAGNGIRYVMKHPVARNVAIMLALVNLVSVSAQSQLVFLAKDHLQADDARLSFLYSAGALGALVLALAANSVSQRISFGRAALGALILRGLAIAGLAVTSEYWLAVPVWALVCGLAAFFNTNIVSLGQAVVPNHMLGRVRTNTAVLALSAIPLGAYAGGVAVEQTESVTLVYGVSGMLVCVTALLFSFTALGRAELRSTEDAPDLSGQGLQD